MREVSVIGIGQTDVAEHWDKSVKELAFEAISAAVADAQLESSSKIGALYVSNMIAGQISQQMHLGAQIADFSGYRGMEAYSIEAACASGGAAGRSRGAAVASGLYDLGVVG